MADHFPDAERAVTFLQQSCVRYDLVVVEPDNMPGMGGYAFCSWFKQEETTLPGYKVAPGGAALTTDLIVVSATPEQESCRAFGADCCFSKPFSPQCFAAAIHGWLKTRQQRRRKTKAEMA